MSVTDQPTVPIDTKALADAIAQAQAAQTPTASVTTVATANASMPTVAMALKYVIPVITIVGLIVLLALSDIDRASGIALIAALAGIHGGAAIANSMNGTG